METNTYTILEAKRADIEKKIKRLQKKAQKYGAPLSVSYGEPYAIEISHRNDDNTVTTNKYEVFDLTIESDTIRKDGYTVIAHIEHADNGNIVNVFEGEVKAEWITMAPFCDHCNSNHGLKVTFIVSNGDEIKQVGRTCLKDYCGIDPQMVGMLNAFHEEIEEYTPEGCDYADIPCVFDATEVLALAIETVKEQGYVKSDEINSNKSIISKKIGHGDRTTLEIMAEAETMAEMIKNMSIDEAIDAKLNNVQARLKGFYCKPSDFGYFAYAPVAYERYMKRIEEQKRRAEEHETMGAQSEYVGTIGERSEFAIKETKLLTTFPSAYGTTFLYRFIDANNNVLVWFASDSFGHWDNGEWKQYDASKIKATVKAHSERDGVKQTILTRVKVA